MQTVIIVEDDADIREILSFNVENAGYSVVGASSAEDAEGLAEKASLILLDVMLPGMSGCQFAKKLRSEGNDVPIIFLTARTEGVRTGTLNCQKCGCIPQRNHIGIHQKGRRTALRYGIQTIDLPGRTIVPIPRKIRIFEQISKTCIYEKVLSFSCGSDPGVGLRGLFRLDHRSFHKTVCRCRNIS